MLESYVFVCSQFLAFFLFFADPITANTAAFKAGCQSMPWGDNLGQIGVMQSYAQASVDEEIYDVLDILLLGRFFRRR